VSKKRPVHWIDGPTRHAPPRIVLRGLQLAPGAANPLTCRRRASLLGPSHEVPRGTPYAAGTRPTFRFPFSCAPRSVDHLSSADNPARERTRTMKCQLCGCERQERTDGFAPCQECELAGDWDMGPAAYQRALFGLWFEPGFVADHGDPTARRMMELAEVAA